MTNIIDLVTAICGIINPSVSIVTKILPIKLHSLYLQPRVSCMVISTTFNVGWHRIHGKAASGEDHSLNAKCIFF